MRAKANRLWLAVCRRTRQVVAFTLGDRGEQSARWLAESIPEALRGLPDALGPLRSLPLGVLPAH